MLPKHLFSTPLKTLVETTVFWCFQVVEKGCLGTNGLTCHCFCGHCCHYEHSQLTFTCSKSTIKTLKKVWNKFITKNAITTQKIKFSIKGSFGKCDQIRSFQRIWSHLTRKSLIENLIFCAVKLTNCAVFSFGSNWYQNMGSCSHIHMNKAQQSFSDFKAFYEFDWLNILLRILALRILILITGGNDW